MDDVFEARLRCAVQAGWRALVIGVLFVTFGWLVYLWTVATHPIWVLPLSGPGLTWSKIETVGLWSIAVMKIGLYAMAFLVVWGALWLSRLRKLREPEAREATTAAPSAQPLAEGPRTPLAPTAR